jgi:hypothetical protein
MYRFLPSESAHKRECGVEDAECSKERCERNKKGAQRMGRSRHVRIVPQSESS